MNPTVFRAVLGKRLVFKAQDADGTEAFLAQRRRAGRLQEDQPGQHLPLRRQRPPGSHPRILIGPLPGEAMEALAQYEGRNYKKVWLEVRTAHQTVPAVAFVANPEQMSHTFGYEFRDHLKQEVLLRGKIDKVLADIRQAQGRRDSDADRRALAELHGQTIRDLIREHFDSRRHQQFLHPPVAGGRAAARLRAAGGAAAARGGSPGRTSTWWSARCCSTRSRTACARSSATTWTTCGSATASTSGRSPPWPTLRMLNENLNLLDILAGDALARPGLRGQPPDRLRPLGRPGRRLGVRLEGGPAATALHPHAHGPRRHPAGGGAGVLQHRPLRHRRRAAGRRRAGRGSTTASCTSATSAWTS